MKVIIDVDKDYYALIKHDVKSGNDYKPCVLIANGKPCGKTPEGEWIWLGDNPNPNHKYSCSKCGRGVKEQENFCPTCGTKMKWPWC